MSEVNNLNKTNSKSTNKVKKNYKRFFNFVSKKKTTSSNKKFFKSNRNNNYKSNQNKRNYKKYNSYINQSDITSRLLNYSNDDISLDILKNNNILYLYFIGGVTEIGRSACIMAFNQEFILVDCGIKFVNDDFYKRYVRFATADFRFIIKNKNLFKAIYLTHGHEDHTGAVALLLKLLDCKIDIYGGNVSLEFAKRNFIKYGLKVENYNFISLIPSKKVFLTKNISALPFHVTHSIPDAFTTRFEFGDKISLLHSGDFKIDLENIYSKYDFKGVIENNFRKTDIMLCECTNSVKSGYSLSEFNVFRSFEELFNRHHGRIVIGLFASHLHRIILLLKLCMKYKKRVFILGSSIQQNLEIAKKLKFLTIPRNIIQNFSLINKFKDNNIVILCAGTQGDSNGSTYKLIFNKYYNIKLSSKKNDIFIFSSTIIPGNDKKILFMINELLSRNIKVVYKLNDHSGFHASGHAYEKEFKLFYSFVEPKYLMLIHGEPIHTYYQKKNAGEVGMDVNKVFRPQLGSVWAYESKNKTLLKVVDHDYKPLFLDHRGVLFQNNKIRNSLSCYNGICLFERIDNNKINIKFYGYINQLLNDKEKKDINAKIINKMFKEKKVFTEIEIRKMINDILLSFIYPDKLPLIIITIYNNVIKKDIKK